MAAGKTVTLNVADPAKVAILNGGERTLGCGPQKPSPRVKIEAGASGEVLSVEFLP